MESAFESLNVVAASSKATLCLFQFSRAFAGLYRVPLKIVVHWHFTTFSVVNQLNIGQANSGNKEPRGLGIDHLGPPIDRPGRFPFLMHHRVPLADTDDAHAFRGNPGVHQKPLDRLGPPSPQTDVVDV